MSEDRFQRCVRFILRPDVEGEYSNDPADRGHATHWGISAVILRRAIDEGLVPPETTPQTLTKDQAEHIYYPFYFLASRAYELPPPLDLLLFDAYVNHRPSAAVELIQAAVGSKSDGVLGPKTIAAAHEVDPRTAVERYATARQELYHRIVAADPTQRTFIHGWLNRVAHLKTAAMSEIT